MTFAAPRGIAIQLNRFWLGLRIAHRVIRLGYVLIARALAS